MAYDKEYATNKANQDLMASENIQEMLKVMQFIVSDIEYERLDNFVIEEKQKIDTNKLKYAFVIDGSKYETSYTENSNAKLCLFNINQCAINLTKLVSYLSESFPFPNQYKQIKEDVSISTFLPIKGMRTQEFKEEKDLFRNFLYSILENTHNPFCDWLESNGYKIKQKETILETYLHLLNNVTDIKNIHIPCPDCRKANRHMSLKSFKDETNNRWLSHINCKCNLEPKKLYTTDFLGFHEQLNNETSNESLTTQIMLVLEKLSLVNMLRNIRKNGHDDLIKESVFIMDGPLAVYSHACWLSQAINKEIIDIKAELPLLVVGVEKTGAFVDNLKKVDDHFAEIPFKKGMLFFLNDEYIKKYIKTYDNEGFYGETTYFGKKLFYKNKLDKLFVINVAFEDEHDKNTDLNNRNSFAYREKVTRLNDLIILLDNFSSQNYENALSLISLANEGAALSSSYLGKKLLNEHVLNLFNKEKA